jgi:hypothetical protein
MAKTYEGNAVETLKTGWKNYQQFCLDFVQEDRKTNWTTTELQELIEKSFEPQIVKLQRFTVAAYKSIEPLIIAGYSLNEMLELVRWFSKKPFRFGGDKQIIIERIINGLDAVLKAAIKPTRAEIEALIKSLLDWQKEQSEYITSIDPDEDRILTPVDKLRLARLADQAKLFLQNSPSHKNVFQDFIIAYSKNNIPAMLGTVTKLLDALCEIRNTLPNSGKAEDTSGEESNLTKVPISELIKKGESQILEFKETLEYATKENKKNGDVLFSSLKTVAGFLNAKSGTLLIGVDDSGNIRGIERDFSIMKHGNNDRFEQKIRNCLKDRFKPQPIGKVNISFEKFTEGTICRVDVHASQEIVHLDNKVYVRDGNTTQLLEGQSLTDWFEQRLAVSKK